ncbi:MULTISPECIES: HAMP domain-containing sensor histidine kinase [Micromonospora]|uniref:Signal transduction histidine-protein kinase/phosphatase MprB n=1 Tax=Micromonospora yangpuensis TaxID=683228 RepID=A0A1C6VI80_9ACTN|nr:HAMP domain-containing sensor histidine kinase [Micromonospora yangpuensis]GGM00260.1 two-component sensor histidine kinase [Micromonospora yangpuensis]SCL66058.1 Signal transduction histidine kinase [Micromonospora yangpuensis]
MTDHAAVIWLNRVLPRPLDPVRSIKVKLGVLLVTSGTAGLSYFWYAIGWLPPMTSATAIGLALLTSQVLAHGMTSPLREMTAAAGAMARGDYSRRVRATSRDEVGELAQAFNKMAADLAVADQRRRELIANVSHELRTPITSLQGVLENLVDGVAEPDPATLRVALTQTERLGHLVVDLLDLSRLDAGVVPLRRVRIDLADFLDEAVEHAAANAAGVGRDVRFQLGPLATPLTGYADPWRLHQVFANLLDNAARHSPPGATVRVTAEERDGLLHFEVSDEGAGIPEAERSRVFERFTRGDRSGDGGTGLGLAIARWVVHLHGGTIAVLDPLPPGGGCRIQVTLPMGQEAR